MKRNWNNFARIALSLVSVLIISLYPAVSSAADKADVKEQIESLAEANFLKPLPHLGTCKSIEFKVRVGNVFKLVGIPDTQLKVAVPYEIYWHPASDDGLVSGKKVHQGILDVKTDNQSFLVKYDPKSNPHGAKGTYVLKVKLNVNDQVIGKILIAKLVFNLDCGSDRPGTPGDPGGGTQPGNPNDPGNSNDPGDPQDPGKPNDPGKPDDPGNQDDPKIPPADDGNDPGDDGKSENPKQPQGGKLPKTATSYGNGMMYGLGGILAGIVLYILSLVNKRKFVF